MRDLTDNQLMLLVKAGQYTELDRLYEKYSRQLFGFFYQMTQVRELSEDLVQDVFYRMLKYRGSFKGDGAFTTWMFHIARNVLKDNKNKLRQKPISQGLEMAIDHPDPDNATDEQFRKRQDQKDLQKAISRLQHEEKEIIVLSKLHGLRYAEIAKILSISEGAVKVRVHRAFNQLKIICQKSGWI